MHESPFAIGQAVNVPRLNLRGTVAGLYFGRNGRNRIEVEYVDSAGRDATTWQDDVDVIPA